jgi:energy-coupling factor transporter ATP-binding protein EcfA2
MAVPVSNPFSTRYTRPGCIHPLDGGGRRVDVDGLLERLQRLGGTAAIVGPHGSGKSTLLAHLAEAIERRGGNASRIRLQASRDAWTAWRAIRQSAAGATICIDSWERIGLATRGLLRVAACLSGCGLLVTSHRWAGMPELTRCATSAKLLRAIVGSLPDHVCWHGTLIHDADIEAAFAIHGGNLRESLYELYDRFEARGKRIHGASGAGPADRDGSDGGRHGIHESADGFSYAGAPERNLG